MPLDYKAAGVDIALGDSASKIMYRASVETWKNRTDLPGAVESTIDFFGALRTVDVSKFGDAVLGVNFDGVGTKIEVAERLNDHRTVAFDLFAMVCDDASIRGAEPVLFGSILDFNRVSIPVVQQLAEGMVAAAKVARVAVMNGEVAELGDRVNGYSTSAYNWGAAIVWIGRKARLLTGSRISAGQSIVAVRENGFRSNGLSLVRKAFRSRYGEAWHETDFKGRRLGESVLFPSVLYTPLLVTLCGGYSGQSCADIAAAVHITGGGIPGKLQRVLTGTGLGAELDALFPPCDAMLHAQDIADIDDTHAYETWNMGQGLLILTAHPADVQAVAQQQGFETLLAGRVSSTPGVRIVSRGRQHPGKLFAFQAA